MTVSGLSEKLRSSSKRQTVNPDTYSQACAAAGFHYAGLEVCGGGQISQVRVVRLVKVVRLVR